MNHPMAMQRGTRSMLARLPKGAAKKKQVKQVGCIDALRAARTSKEALKIFTIAHTTPGVSPQTLAKLTRIFEQKFPNEMITP